MRRILFAVLFLAAATAGGAVTFVAPQEGAQAIGPLTIEVTTDARQVDRVDFFVDGSLAGVARTAPYRIVFDFGTSLTARKVSAKVWSGGYKQSESAAITTAALTANESIHVDLVEVPLRVRTSRKLSAADLRIEENGAPQTIRDVRAGRPPAHFAFIVDRSLSMGDGKLTATFAAIEQALTQLRAGDTASLVLFHHNVSKAKPIARGTKLTADVVPSGGTSLRDAVASVASDERTYAIVITDGGDRSSELTEEAALRRISGTKTIAHAIVLGSSHTRFLDLAAKNTGGAVVSASKDTVGSALRDVLDDINSRYTVVYQSNNAKRGWRTLRVSAKRAGVSIISARKGYFAR
ncbi:MAG TPA: Ig-like domain-containing protein [Thermoanaerobaculia bacterium]